MARDNTTTYLLWEGREGGREGAWIRSPNPHRLVSPSSHIIKKSSLRARAEECVWRSFPLPAVLAMASDVPANDTTKRGVWFQDRPLFLFLSFWPLTMLLTSQHTGAGRLTGPHRYSSIITYTRMGTCSYPTNSILCFSPRQVRPSWRHASSIMQTESCRQHHASSIPCSGSPVLSVREPSNSSSTQLNHMGREAPRRWAAPPGVLRPQAGPGTSQSLKSLTHTMWLALDSHCLYVCSNGWARLSFESSPTSPYLAGCSSLKTASISSRSIEA